MNPSRIFIERPVATSLFMIAIFLAGLVAYRVLPLSALPEVEYPNDASLHFMSADVLAEPQEVRNGAMNLPAGDGLGVTLDRGKLDRLALESAEIRT